jgi:hypothetical protein
MDKSGRFHPLRGRGSGSGFTVQVEKSGVGVQGSGKSKSRPQGGPAFFEKRFFQLFLDVTV